MAGSVLDAGATLSNGGTMRNSLPQSIPHGRLSDLYHELNDLTQQHNRGTWNRKDPLMVEAERLAGFQP